MHIQKQLQNYKERVEQALRWRLPQADTEPEILHEAMRYAVLNNGKRIRPLLTYTTGEMLDINPDYLDGIACAVEFIHCYSMIHDDLPAMDDDDLRRNQPTVHIAFDEATAILAGDALQGLAFQVLAEDHKLGTDRRQQINIISTLAYAAGSSGMAGGQAIDLAAEHKQLSLAELENMHSLKTGQLIKAAVLMPCHLKDELDETAFEHLTRFAECVGLAFQIRDDILDVIGNTETIGKPQGSDASHEKATYVSLLGLDAASEKANDLYNEALNLLSGYGEKAESLRYLAKLIVEREF